MATPNYSVNYDDKRFVEVEADKKAALNEVDVTYGNMISSSDKYYADQQKAVQDYADKQTAIQNQQTEFAIEKIEQQKAQAQKDYTKEQSGAYVDWQKQSNEYGANAEAMAAQGMANSGYSESSQVSMFNTYQTRVVAAREVFSRAVLEYDNAIKDARLQNNAALAEIAFNTLQKKLELSLQGFQYKNQLILEKANKRQALDSEYHSRYQDVLKQINQENALKEEVRQYNESKALEQAKLDEEKRQYNESKALEEAQLAEQQRQFNVAQAAKASGGSSGGGKSSGGSSSSKKNATIRGTGVNAVKAVNKDAVDGGSSELTVDTKSVLNLGYGPISASRLNELVKSGIVEEYQSGNKLKYRKSASTNKQFSLYKSL